MFEMKQAQGIEDWSICGADMVYAPRDVVGGIFGDPNVDVRGNMFMYLFRRFGYPMWGWDDHKSVVSYYLTTPDSDVILWVDPKSFLLGSFGYGVSRELDRESNSALLAWRKSRQGEWEQTPIYERIDTAIKAAMQELLRPVFIRDVPYNLLGKHEYTVLNCNDDEDVEYDYVEPSPQAGYGVGNFDPVKASE